MYEMVENVGDKANRVISDLNRKVCSGYAKATDVYSCDDGYVGVTGSVEKFDECAMWEDFFKACFAEEYEVVRTFTYVPKDNN